MVHCITTTKQTILVIVLALQCVLLTGCQKHPAATAAPLNDMSSLEHLASAYKEVSEQLPVSPVNLAPKARKKFVQQVFEKAGYGYTETLVSLSNARTGEITKLHRDMQELLFLPHYGLQKDIIQEIYTEEEQRAIEEINANFH